MVDDVFDDGVADDGTLISGESMMGPAVALARLGPGRQLGPFELVGRVEIGEQDVRYAAVDTRSDRQVQLRLLRPDAGLQRARDHYLRVAALHHPCLGETLEISEFGGVLCVAEAPTQGQPLRAWLDAHSRAWRPRLALMRPLVELIALAHREGLVHGALRADALLVRASGDIELVEFAPPRLGLRMPVSELSPWTAYLAPEQLAGKPGDARSDQFTLCTLIYEALYGEHPFAARSAEVQREQMAGDRLHPAPDGSRVPASLHAVLARGLTHDPEARWPSVDALLEGLDGPHRGRLRALVRGLMGRS